MKPLHRLEAGDTCAMAWGFFAASVLAAALALWFDWSLVGGVLSFLRTNQNIAAYALGLDLLPWATAFTLLTGGSAGLGLWLAKRADRAGTATAAAGSPRSARQPGSHAFRPIRRPCLPSGHPA